MTRRRSNISLWKKKDQVPSVLDTNFKVRVKGGSALNKLSVEELSKILEQMNPSLWVIPAGLTADKLATLQKKINDEINRAHALRQRYQDHIEIRPR